MRKFLTITMILFLTITINAQKNHPLFSIEDCSTVCLIDQEPIMFSIESSGDFPKIVQRSLNTGEITNTFEAKLPDNPVLHIVPNNKKGLLYLVTIKNDTESRRKYFTGIYSFSPKEDKVELLYNEQKEVSAPVSADLVENKLVLAISVYKKHPLVFNIESLEFETFSDVADIRMLCAAPEQKGFVVINYNEFDNDDNAPVYFMGLDRKISEKLGMYNSTLSVSTNKDENSLPGFNITNTEYDWISSVYNKSGFPHSGFSIATRAGLSELYSSLGNQFDISTILDANDNYLAAKGKGQVFIYNIKNPTLEKKQTVSEEDLKAIKDYFSAKVSYEKTKLNSSALSKVFSVNFYLITETTQLDESSFTTSSFIVTEKDNSFEVLKNKSDLHFVLDASFRLGNEAEAALFQDALNAIYPPGTFEKKHIAFYQKNNDWFFVRNVSFDEKEGFIVSVDSDKKVTDIKYKRNMDSL